VRNPIRLLIVICLLLPGPLGAQDSEPVVHAVLFYSPTCPHCHQVITEYLIPLQNRFGNSLVILGMDTSRPDANNLWWEAVRHFKVPEENWAVPFLVVGDEVLVGGIEIPNRFTAIVEAGLASGGIDLPDYPAFRTFLQEQDLLDPRFPARLVMKPRPAPEPETEPETPTPTGEQVGEDSAAEAVRAGEAPPSRDTARAGDTTAVRPEVAVGDSSAADESPDDTIAGSRDVPTSPSKEDSAAIESGVAGGGAGAASHGPEREREVPAGERDTARPGPAPPEGNPEGASAGGMIRGLDDAASDFESVTMWDRFRLDPTGNGISVLVLLVMFVSLGLRGFPTRSNGGLWPSWAVPALVSVGVLVAGYLTFVEVSQVQAVCGPVGDCNTVNQSEYAMLFGVLPVGLLGLVGYAVILLLWLASRTGSAKTRRLATLGLWASVVFGVLFSIYLTFLEPFVIGASCAWCLTSAMVMTLLLWAVTPLASRSWSEPGTARGEG